MTFSVPDLFSSLDRGYSWTVPGRPVSGGRFRRSTGRSGEGSADMGRLCFGKSMC